ncbi:hypothetical protein OKW21_005273 [Catalinimonas alkaloidigena]|uniref:hypothetical protein n=1 Tax=Catalinimonas alkaloidigena TaxID=1075417 RepID=UPI002405F5A3|nr:hypothetical protein [Catalinimonas alkaloidigena]MDF9800010.1 hypothetical protein [Catalinimonas alkaloidigena]
MNSPIQSLKKYIIHLLIKAGAYPGNHSHFSCRRKLAQLKKRTSNGVRLVVFLVAIFSLGLLTSFPKSPYESGPALLSKLHDNWYAEPERMTKNCKALPHLSNLKINIRPLSSDKVIIYAKPSSAVIPASLVLQLQQTENLVEGRVFRAVRQTDSVDFNMILSEKGNKLTLAFALDGDLTSGEYVLSFLRQESESSDLFSY